MATQLSLPQNGLRVGEQIVTDGDSVTLGNNVGVKNNLTVGGSVLANRVITPFVTKEQTTVTPIVIDCSYTDHRILLKSNAVGINFTNVPSARDGTFRVKVYLIQDTLGNRTVDWSVNQGSTPTYPVIVWTNTGSDSTVSVYPQLQTINARVDVFEFITFDGGLNWVGTQVNPNTVQYNSFRDILYAVSNSVNGSVPALPASYPGSGVMPNYGGTVVQTKTAVNTSILTFGNSSSTPIDVVTISFKPKYKDSRLIISGQFTTSASGSYPADFSVRGYFTLGTNPIQVGLNTTGAGGNLFYYDVFPNQSDRQQAAHFGGYFYAMNSNMHLNRTAEIYFDHNTPAGSTLDLRIRVVHADAWGARSCVVGTSWTGTSNGQGSYTCQVPSTLTVMEVLV